MYGLLGARAELCRGAMRHRSAPSWTWGGTAGGKPTAKMIVPFAMAYSHCCHRVGRKGGKDGKHQDQGTRQEHAAQERPR
jgi:hypothetical protein